MEAVAYEQLGVQTEIFNEAVTREWPSDGRAPMAIELEDELKRNIGTYIKGLHVLEDLNWFEDPKEYARTYARLYDRCVMTIQALDEYCLTGEIRPDLDEWCDFNKDFVGNGCEPGITDDLVGILHAHGILKASA